jgi:hypothetical protein
MSSPGSAIVRFDVPRWLFADSAGCVVWLALAIALEIVARPALGLPPGSGVLLGVIPGVLATRAATRCRRRPMALVIDGRRIVIVTVDGRPAAVRSLEGSRVIGRTILADLGTAAAPGPRRYRLWVTPHDVPAAALRRLALALRFHGGRPEA